MHLFETPENRAAESALMLWHRQQCWGWGGENPTLRTFVSQHGDGDGQQGAQHVEQSDGGLECPLILTLGALGALLDACSGGNGEDRNDFEFFGFFFFFLPGLPVDLQLTAGDPHLDKQATLKRPAIPLSPPTPQWWRARGQKNITPQSLVYSQATSMLFVWSPPPRYIPEKHPPGKEGNSISSA